MERSEIITKALNVLYDEFVNNNKVFITYESFADDKDNITITAKRNINYDMISRSDWEKYISKCKGPSMSLTTFDEFDGSCELSYCDGKNKKMYAVHWKDSKEMVKELVSTVGTDLYDQLLTILSINSYNIRKLMREGGELNG